MRTPHRPVGPIGWAAAIVAALLQPLASAAPGWNNFEAADVVVGTTTLASPTTLFQPFGVIVEPVSGKVFVADSGNNRVLRFSSVAALKSGSPAEGVLGQPDLYSDLPGLGDSRMSEPSGMALDHTGGLWVVDVGNSRVLRFEKVATATNGTPAIQVLGKSDFNANDGVNGAANLFRPTGAAMDSKGRLWVADYFNNRVLRFDNAINRGNGAAADGVLGQPDFNSFDAGTSSAEFNDVYDVAVDAQDRLWVADAANNRVLRFDHPASGNQVAPDGVLGQLNFDTSTSGNGPAGLSRPGHLAVSTDDRLYVANSGGQRILRWDQASTKTNGASADGVLGRLSLTEDAESPDPAGAFTDLQGISLDPSGRLLAVDAEWNRLLIWNDAANQPAGALANTVLGQPNLQTLPRLDPAAGLTWPRQGLEDPVSHKYFLADQGRVLRFASRAALEAGHAPEAFLGQTQPADTGGGAISDTLLRSSWGLALDATGQLWVSDPNANRVVAFAQAATAPTGATMSHVLGQPTFTGSAAALTQAGMNEPRGLLFDPAGNLYVADTGNHRVLRFPAASLVNNGAPANAVFGESDFVSIAPPATIERLTTPTGLAFDALGHLWVADLGKNRVVRYDQPLIDSGLVKPAATFGGLASASASGMNAPTALFFLGETLWVLDSAFNRILRFEHAANKVGIANADGVLGAPTMNGYSGFSRSRRMMRRPDAAWTDLQGSIWVADINNQRLLRFTPDTPVISSTELTTDGRLKIGYEVEAGSDYEVQTTSDFVTWHTIENRHANTTGRLNFEETQPSNGQYYRVLEH